MSTPQSPSGHRGQVTHDPARGVPVQAGTVVVAAVFVLVGMLGFVPGITTGVDQLSFAGHHSGAELVGVFQVSVLHNLVHLAFGVVGLVMARDPRTAVPYLLVGGVVYLVLWVYGLAIDFDSAANVVPLDDADNWLHLGLGVGMVALGLAGRAALRGHVAGRA